MIGDDAVDDAQAEAGPTPRLLGREERFEDPLERVGPHPLAVVDDHEPRVLTRRQRVRRLTLAIDDDAIDDERDFTDAALHGVPRVGRQVHQHLVNLRWIDEDVWRAGLHGRADAGASGHRRAQQPDDLIDEGG